MRLPPETRNRVIGIVIQKGGEAKRFRGEVSSHTDSYCFVRDVSLGDDTFIHYSEFSDDDWRHIAEGGKVEFSLGFCVKGAQGKQAMRISH